MRFMAVGREWTTGRRVGEGIDPNEDIGDFARAQTVRQEAVLALSTSERLARMHTLCKQMSAIKAAASVR